FADLRAVVVDPLVNLVGEQPEVAVAAELEQPLLFADIGDPTEGIRRRGEHDEAGPRSGRGRERVEIDRVALSCQRERHLDLDGVRERDDRGAVGPSGREDYCLVASVARGADRWMECL